MHCADAAEVRKPSVKPRAFECSSIDARVNATWFMTSRLGSLVAATTKTALPRLSSCSTSLSRHASVDRYTAIRSFFHRQEREYRQDAGSAFMTRVNWAHDTRGSARFNSSSLLVELIGTRRGLHTFSPRRQTERLSPSEKDAEPYPGVKRPPDTNSSRASSSQQDSSPGHESDTPPQPAPNIENYSAFFRRLALSLPHLHRPTKDDFLNVASGFWQRARIRFKWFTIKSFRKFNADDISAFVTWFVMSQTLWVLVGTTTFFSVVFATINSLRLQEYVARAISDYLTSETGVTIIFESAIVPKWKDSRISFKNVYVSCRPPTTQARTQNLKVDIGHRAAAGYDVANHPSFFHHEDENDAVVEALGEVEEDWNYSMFDLTIDSVDVTLSLWRWLDGRGLVEDAVVKGVRGVLDRRSVVWDPDLEPALFRHPSRPGDFELDSLQLEDVLITVYQPDGFRPYTASIFHANIQAFRKQWLFYDILNAESMVGQFDGCLFSLHRPQRIGRTNESDVREGDQNRMTRIRMDGVNVDHLQGSTSSSDGPVSWITSGKVDAVLDITFPRDTTSLDLNELLGEIADSITSSLALDRIPGQRELAKPPLSAPDTSAGSTSGSSDSKTLLAASEGDEDADPIIVVEEQPKVMIDIDLRFRDLKAAVPMFPGELSYVNSALIRPIVAFINANRVLVPIHCRVVKNLSDFEGSWTMWEAGLTDEISLKMYEALAHHVTQINMNRRIKTVSIWSLHLTVNALLRSLRSAMDPVTSHLKEVYANGHESGLGYGMAFAS